MQVTWTPAIAPYLCWASTALTIFGQSWIRKNRNKAFNLPLIVSLGCHTVVEQVGHPPMPRLWIQSCRDWASTDTYLGPAWTVVQGKYPCCQCAFFLRHCCFSPIFFFFRGRQTQASISTHCLRHITRKLSRSPKAYFFLCENTFVQLQRLIFIA